MDKADDMQMHPMRAAYRGLSDRVGPELTTTAIRFLIVTTAMVYFHSEFFAGRSGNEQFVSYAHYAVRTAFCMTLLIAAWIVFAPRPSAPRRIAGLLHDIAAVSIAMYLGESAAAPVASIYIWVALGGGFRFGVGYLYAGAVMALVGFSCVYFSSDYWRTQGTLSFNIFLLLLLIPPYVGALLKSLHGARERLHKQAHTDGLTGLMNRQAFEGEVDHYLQERNGGHALMFCDLDHFKDVNDTAGHAAGDKLLVDIAAILRDTVRNTDITGRIGGDEFCAFLPNCPAEKAREVAERLRSRVSSYRLAWGTEYYSVGISIGIAPSVCVEDAPSLFRLADAAAYAAKNAGRNQVYVVDPRLDDLDTASVRSLMRPQRKAERA